MPKLTIFERIRIVNFLKKYFILVLHVKGFPEIFSKCFLHLGLVAKLKKNINNLCS